MNIRIILKKNIILLIVFTGLWSPLIRKQKLLDPSKNQAQNNFCITFRVKSHTLFVPTKKTVEVKTIEHDSLLESVARILNVNFLGGKHKFEHLKVFKITLIEDVLSDIHTV